MRSVAARLEGLERAVKGLPVASALSAEEERRELLETLGAKAQGMQAVRDDGHLDITTAGLSLLDSAAVAVYLPMTVREGLALRGHLQEWLGRTDVDGDGGIARWTLEVLEARVRRSGVQ